MTTSTGTYDTITSLVLASNQRSVTFSNLPGNYSVLTLSISGDYDGASGDFLRLWCNNQNTGQYYTNTFSNFCQQVSNTFFQQQNTTSVGFANIAVGSATTHITTQIHMVNTNRGGNGFQPILVDSREFGSTGYAGLGISTLRGDLGINSLTLQWDSNTFRAGTSFVLTGLRASQLKAFGGDWINNDGTNWTHAFYTSGTFTPRENMTAEVLVVAGGGGGGAAKGGGGGAGGICFHSSKSLTANVPYTVTIGAGGTGGTFIAIQGTNGSNSVFDNITALGGGFGGQDFSTFQSGNAGGCGGGATRAGTAGASTQGSSGGATGFGFAGGAGNNGNNNTFAGGGGGGGSAVGGTPPSTGSRIAGAGGAGRNTWEGTIGRFIYYNNGSIAGGGGGGGYSSSGAVDGGAGGVGYGGAGGTYDAADVDQNGLAGNANTGGGGGGGSDGGNGGMGGSGLVFVRYPV